MGLLVVSCVLDKQHSRDLENGRFDLEVDDNIARPAVRHRGSRPKVRKGGRRQTESNIPERREGADIQESCIKLVNPELDFLVSFQSPFGLFKICFNDGAIAQPDFAASGPGLCLGVTFRVRHGVSLAFSKPHTEAEMLTIGRVHTLQYGDCDSQGNELTFSLLVDFTAASPIGPPTTL